MSNEMNNTAVPKLRFPEFEGAGEWEIKELGKLGKFTGGGTPSKENVAFWQGNIPWISSSDLSEDSIQRVKITRFISDEALKESATKLIPENSILLVSRVGVGKLAITMQAVCTSQDFTNFTPSKDDLIFLAYYLKTQSQVLLSYSQGMAIKGFTKDDVSTLKLFVPCLAEQQKIAATLSSLDDLLTAHSAKLAALQAHKRGLMQGLFPAEGETVPKLRFPEFLEAGEWEEKTLGEVATFSKGKGISKADIVPDGALPCIRYGELYTRYGETIDSIISRTNLSPDDLILSQANDVIIPASGETQEDIATASCVMLSGVALGGDLNIIRTKMDGVFLALYLNTAKKQEIAQLAQGISVVHLYSNQLKTLVMFIPSLEEQRKIASCLTSLDNRITAQIQQIEALKLHKKGLMQGLFPAAAE